VLQYFPTTGRFRWRVRHGTRRPRVEAGTRQASGYHRIRVDGVFHSSHRLAWLYVHGEHPTGEINHKNGKRADNRIANLEQLPHRENVWHAVTRRMSGTTGLYRRRGKWEARITVNGRQYCLGTYDTRKEASAAYRCAARLLRGDLAKNARSGRAGAPHHRAGQQGHVRAVSISLDAAGCLSGRCETVAAVRGPI
jgi:HNH endonuclease